MDKRLKMAVIMDEFTYSCYSPECETIQLTPSGFKKEIDGFNPDLVFVESVWRGKDNLWRFKLHDHMEDIIALTDYCKEKNIPVVFWSKEDPVHFGVFIRTAALADYVFTTDADCIEMYKSFLGHNRVYYLPFAAQPAIHNPIEEYDRKDKYCFAGSFYVKYKERSNTFIDLSSLFLEKGLDIYDRNYKKEQSDNNSQTTSVASPVAENYYFPKELQHCILGGLPYSEISRAYKGYKYGVNMTSMVYSGSMFARRVFELLACNTVTVSNYSRGIELLFGDLVIATDNRDNMRAKIERYSKTEQEYRKYRLAGLRHILKENLYEDRLNRISEIVLGRTIRKQSPKILVLCMNKSKKVQEMFDTQTYGNRKLAVINDGSIQDYKFDYVTVFSEDNFYGRNYLLDFALTTRFASDTVIGKVARYTKNGPVELEKAYTRVHVTVDLTRQMISREAIEHVVSLYDISEFQEERDVLAINEFNFCENTDRCRDAEDLELYTGVSLETLYKYTNSISPVELKRNVQISLKELFEELQINSEDYVEKSYEDGKLSLIRDVSDDEIVWLRTNKYCKLSDYATGSRIGFYTKTAKREGNVRCQIEYYDKDLNKLDYLNFSLDGFSLLRISDNATTFKLIFRMRGNASMLLEEMWTSSPKSLLPAPFPIRKSLLITEEYPDYNNPDTAKNLHLFAKKNHLEVLKVSGQASYIPYSEYDGVPIVSTRYDGIREYLSIKSNKRIYVGHLSEDLMKYLAEYEATIIKVESD